MATYTGRILEVPVGRELVGRVADTLGRPIDSRGPINTTQTIPIEKIAPGVIVRRSVNQPTQTSLKAIDSVVPIDRGRRELIIGDRQTDKTVVTLDAIVNQKDTDVICIYVVISQKVSFITNVVRKLEEYGAMEHAVIVAATASETAALQYIAPYAGCTMGKFFRGRSEDVLTVYDDLPKQTVTYRQTFLLLRRSPGREAYPGDVFYLHSRLLERAVHVNQDEVEKLTDGATKGKAGSLTALPIIEAQVGDVSAFVLTNAISVTDGQVFLETDLFNVGIRPAINASISISRTGGVAQTKVIKKLGGGIRPTLAQYHELAVFPQFASDLDEAARKQLQHSEVITELAKQKQLCTLNTVEMALTLWAISNGSYENIPVSKALAFEAEFLSYVRTQQPGVLDVISSSGAMPGESKQILVEAVKPFKSSYTCQA